MDGESFDRLSVVVHRLRDKATRRGALGLLLGGSIAATSSLLGEDAAAKKRNKKDKNRKKDKCRGFGGKCDANRDCCFSNCRNGRCQFSSGGGGGGNKRCGGRKCPANWGCCKSRGVSVCVPNTFPTCCGGSSYLPNYRCCPGGGAVPVGAECCGFNSYCTTGFKCCDNRYCIGDFQDCDDFPLVSRQNGDFSTEAAGSGSVSEPIAVPDEDWIEIDPE